MKKQNQGLRDGLMGSLYKEVSTQRQFRSTSGEGGNMQQLFIKKTLVTESVFGKKYHLVYYYMDYLNPSQLEVFDRLPKPTITFSALKIQEGTYPKLELSQQLPQLFPEAFVSSSPISNIVVKTEPESYSHPNRYHQARNQVHNGAPKVSESQNSAASQAILPGTISRRPSLSIQTPSYVPSSFSSTTRALVSLAHEDHKTNNSMISQDQNYQMSPISQTPSLPSPDRLSFGSQETMPDISLHITPNYITTPMESHRFNIDPSFRPKVANQLAQHPHNLGKSFRPPRSIGYTQRHKPYPNISKPLPGTNLNCHPPNPGTAMSQLSLLASPALLPGSMDGYRSTLMPYAPQTNSHQHLSPHADARIGGTFGVPLNLSYRGQSTEGVNGVHSVENPRIPDTELQQKPPSDVNKKKLEIGYLLN
ncbi:hypothetical protein BKA69DRAFT_1164403 [Paraphysoderma sedebokerense]|nr:hypothetical protein BKA69DRAFT_1164403 [Paraphysoderma sedebokerense]